MPDETENTTPTIEIPVDTRFHGYREVRIDLIGTDRIVIRHHHDGSAEILFNPHEDNSTRSVMSQSTIAALKWAFAPMKVIVG